MKLLIVLVSALVAVAHAKVLAADEAADADVFTLEQSPGASEGQGAYAVEEGAPQGVRVFGAEEKQSAGSPQESANDMFRQPSDGHDRIPAPIGSHDERIWR